MAVDTNFVKDVDVQTSGKRKLRAEPLETAAGAILKDRNDAYGGVEDNFRAIHTLWNAYLFTKFKDNAVQLDDHDVSMLMVLLKMGRILTGVPGILDNYADLIGYAAIGYEQSVNALNNKQALAVESGSLVGWKAMDTLTRMAGMARSLCEAKSPSGVPCGRALGHSGSHEGKEGTKWGSMQ